MNRRQWRQIGYHAILRSGYVFLVHVGSNPPTILRRPIENGHWMKTDNLAQWENWTERASAEALLNFAAAIRDCYCDSLSDQGCCDFCGTCRTPDGAPSSNSWRIVTDRATVADADDTSREDLEAAAEMFDKVTGCHHES